MQRILGFSASSSLQRPRLPKLPFLLLLCCLLLSYPSCCVSLLLSSLSLSLSLVQVVLSSCPCSWTDPYPIRPRFAQLLRSHTGIVLRPAESRTRSAAGMSTAVAEVRPPYGFPGSGKKTGGGHGKGVAAAVGKRRNEGFFIEEDEVEAEEELLTSSSSIGPLSPSSSSIGENSSSEAGAEESEEEGEVESKLKEGDGLGCLDALEDSLPIKKGLSNFYSGKSKSFTSLAEATSTAAAAKELAKPENPYNKRRRILANWSRRASCGSLATATYLPPLLALDHAVAEGDEGEEDDSDSDESGYSRLPHRGKNVRDSPALPLPPPRLSAHARMGMARRNGHGTFRSPRSFSLSDLQNSSTNSSD